MNINLKLFNSIIKKIILDNKIIRIIFPEGNSSIIIKAALKLKKETNIVPVLLCKNNNKFNNSLDGLERIFITEEKINYFAQKLFKIRNGKITLDLAKKLLKNHNYFATMMLNEGQIDGLVGGINYPTADILRPALQIIKTKTGLACSVFIMAKNDEIYLFGDCAFIVEPTSEQLALMAEEYVRFSQKFKLFNDYRVALLSYSSGDSGKGDSVDKVKNAYKILKERNNLSKFYGPIQLDAALLPSIQEKKIIDCPLKGKANIFVFPDLNSGNIGYKIAQRMGHYDSVGPIILGLNKPVMDLSRGASIEDVFHTSLIVAKLILGDE